MVFFGQPLRLCQEAAPREGDRVMRYFAWISGAAGLALLSGAAWADDTLRLSVGAPHKGDSGVSDVGVRAGIFKKHGLALELLYTQGGGETMQAVIAGSADIGIAAGTAGVMGAFAKGAPVRIIAAGTTGAGDLYWYVPASSPIRSFKELAGKTGGNTTTHPSVSAVLYASAPPTAPSRSFKELDGKTVGYSTNAPSPHTTWRTLIKHYW